MSVRDLLSLAPGSVVELDRAAGSPIDVLVNGTLIARGEVVVIDEEFGIRIMEIVSADNPLAKRTRPLMGVQRVSHLDARTPHVFYGRGSWADVATCSIHAQSH